jgi:hypothetical protein
MEQLQGPEVVDLHLAPGLLEDRSIRDSLAEHDAGVVEDELDVRSRVAGRTDLVHVRHVEPQRNQPLVAQGAQRLRIARCGVDLPHAPGQERFRQGSPDAAVGARHQGDCSFDSQCVRHEINLSAGDRRWE